MKIKKQRSPIAIAKIKEIKVAINGSVDYYGAVINTGSGKVRITIDNDGKITNAKISVKPVKDFESSLEGKKQTKDPNITKAIKKDLIECPKSRGDAFANILESTKNEKANSFIFKEQKIKVIRNKVGYDISRNYGSITAHREVEISFQTL